MVHDVEKLMVTLDQVFVVQEFLDVFPEELLGLPLNQEIKFGINMILDTQ